MLSFKCFCLAALSWAEESLEIKEQLINIKENKLIFFIKSILILGA
jgi:hypothetical protein